VRIFFFFPHLIRHLVPPNREPPDTPHHESPLFVEFSPIRDLMSFFSPLLPFRVFCSRHLRCPFVQTRFFHSRKGAPFSALGKLFLSRGQFEMQIWYLSGFNPLEDSLHLDATPGRLTEPTAPISLPRQLGLGPALSTHRSPELVSAAMLFFSLPSPTLLRDLRSVFWLFFPC